MKNISFLIGLPRAGNTLLASLVKQSNNLIVTANSITSDILYEVYKLKYTSIFQNFPDNESMDNVLKNLLPSYYSHWQVDNILDRGPWGTPANLSIINEMQTNPKFVVLYRPVQECVASFVKLYKPQNVEQHIRDLLSNDSVLGKNIWAINNLIENNIPFHLITYNNLIKNPENTLKNLFNFLDLKMPKINFNNLKQLNINGNVYNDNVAIKDLHKVRSEIKKINYDIKQYVSDDMIKLCKKYDPKII